MSTTLVIGFDSAWSRNNSGAIVGVFKQDNVSYKPLDKPQVANFAEATNRIEKWQSDHKPTTTLILIDQPIIVPNIGGQRHVENIVGSPVSKRYGGVQPANRGREDMFGNNAPIWQFLKDFDGPFDPTVKPLNQPPVNCVIETYPVLTLIAMHWLLDDNHSKPRATKRLPKYNPNKPKTFSMDDWQYVCTQAAKAFKQTGLLHLVEWINAASENLPARKQMQDCLDACLCLLVGLRLIEGKDCLFVGDMDTGYMVVPYGEILFQELEDRCKQTDREPSDWLRKFKIR